MPWETPLVVCHYPWCERVCKITSSTLGVSSMFGVNLRQCSDQTMNNAVGHSFESSETPPCKKYRTWEMFIVEVLFLTAFTPNN